MWDLENNNKKMIASSMVYFDSHVYLVFVFIQVKIALGAFLFLFGQSSFYAVVFPRILIKKILCHFSMNNDIKEIG